MNGSLLSRVPLSLHSLGGPAYRLGDAVSLRASSASAAGTRFPSIPAPFRFRRLPIVSAASFGDRSSPGPSPRAKEGIREPSGTGRVRGSFPAGGRGAPGGRGGGRGGRGYGRDSPYARRYRPPHPTTKQIERNRRLTQLRDPNALLAEVTSGIVSGELNEVNMATFLNRLADICARDARSRSLTLAHKDVRDVLATIPQYVRTMDPQGSVTALHALATLVQHDTTGTVARWPETLAALAPLAQRIVHLQFDSGFSPQSFSLTMWSLAYLPREHLGLELAEMGGLLRRAADKAFLDAMAPQALSNSAWAIARMDLITSENAMVALAARELLLRIQEATIERFNAGLFTEWISQELVNVVWALGYTSVISRPMLHASYAPYHYFSRSEGLNAQQVSNTLLALHWFIESNVRDFAQDIINAHLDLLDTALAEQEVLNDQDAGNTLFSCCQMRYLPVRGLENILTTIERELLNFSPEGYSQLFIAIAVLLSPLRHASPASVATWPPELQRVRLKIPQLIESVSRAAQMRVFTEERSTVDMQVAFNALYGLAVMGEFQQPLFKQLLSVTYRTFFSTDELMAELPAVASGQIVRAVQAYRVWCKRHHVPEDLPEGLAEVLPVFSRVAARQTDLLLSKTTESNFQQEVTEMLVFLLQEHHKGVTITTEKAVAGGLSSVDISVEFPNGRHVAFEVDGPMHFLRFHDPARPAPPPPTISEPEAAGDAPVTTLRSSPVIVLGGVMDGLSSFRNRGLGSLGIDVVSVPYYRVPTRGNAMNRRKLEVTTLLCQLFQAAGIFSREQAARCVAMGIALPEAQDAEGFEQYVRLAEKARIPATPDVRIVPRRPVAAVATAETPTARVEDAGVATVVPVPVPVLGKSQRARRVQRRPT